jgi:hypothetical protein
MIAFYPEYKSEDQPPGEAAKASTQSDCQLASILAFKILEAFELSETQDAVFFTGQSWMDPGPLIAWDELEIVLGKFKGTALLPQDGNDPNQTAEQLIAKMKAEHPKVKEFLTGLNSAAAAEKKNEILAVKRSI